jgi:hypothetical protein
VNEVELRLILADDGEQMRVHVLIDGRDLLDRVKVAELPQATADGQPDLAGSYQALTSEQWAALPEQYGDGRAAVLGCICGEVGCWPFRVRITWRSDTVTWSDFKQKNRGWTYEALGPFVFAREQYEAAVSRAVAGRGAGPVNERRHGREGRGG